MNTTRLSQGWPVVYKEIRTITAGTIVEDGKVFLNAADIVEELESVEDPETYDVPLLSLILMFKSLQVDALTQDAIRRSSTTNVK